ncbi:MAG: hypothetical protein JSU70_16655 [Phycisphaerales bacterium]|nr:MAG: hypothetical protein JSU70_16655 [Phycisphaerales bacterium]
MHKSIKSGMLCLAVLTIVSATAAGEPHTEATVSLNASANDKNHQQVLIGPMEPGDNIAAGGWRMKDFLIKTARNIQAKIGRSALVFEAEAEIAGAKGDFSIHGQLPGNTDVLGLWVYLEEDSNIEKLGIQVYDAQNEAIMMLVPADWRGWKWVEFVAANGSVQQAYPQSDKNGLIDQPLSSEHVVWFAKAPGATRMVVDGMVAIVDRSGLPDEKDLTVETFACDIVEPGRAVLASVLAVNYTDKPIGVDLTYSFQRDSTLYSAPMPDPVFGSNHAPGLRSWVVTDGEIVEDGSLTDGKPWTDGGTAYKTNHFAEAYQYVELDKLRRITKMTWLSGDANHTWFVDVAASQDGTEFAPIKGLQNVDHYKKWGWNDYPLQSPLEAKVIRFHYHTGDPQKKVHAIRFPCELGLYDGVADEKIALPQVGPVLDNGSLKITVAPRSFNLVDIPARAILKSGACLFGVEAAWSDRRTVACRHIYAALQTDPLLVSADSRFGLNAAHGPLAAKLRGLGVGWVRFENMKWPFVSPEPHKYAFDGSAGPWHVSTDDVFQTYSQNGLNILSYMFLVPEWASSAPPGTKDDRIITFPPKDPALFGEFCFQVAARYGNTEHPAEALLSSDKKSGLGLVHYYEMWNEPGLNPKPDAAWGGWSAPLDEYYKMMRYGAEAIKKADPTATVTSAGYAGIATEIVNRLRTYKYADGKCPLDFVEVINVHYYSGQNPPETARDDGNAGPTSGTTFPQDTEALAVWRDKYAPQMPIWMTETGYDSAGPFGTTEAIQAARLPRVVMLCLAFGVDKVFVYRESGSTPSMHACSGLLRNDFTEKPSWFTFGTLVRQFKKIKGRAVRLPHEDENVWLLKWNEGRKALLTAWAVEGNARLGLNLGPCEITDAFGATFDSEDTSELEITPLPIYVRDMDDNPGWKTMLADYEVRQLELKGRRDRAVACRKYLYDFGTPDRVGEYILEGIRFPYTPVKAAGVWDRARGYGFNIPAMSDENRQWVRSKLDGDGCRIGGGIQFQFRVEPGAYHLSLGFGPFEDTGVVVIEGLKEPLKMLVSREQGLAEADLVVIGTAATLTVSHKGYGDIRWLSLVEKN